MQEIEKLRSEIDQIHVEMVGLFRRRLKLAREIWKLKVAHALPMIDPAREEKIRHRFDHEITDQLEQKAVQNLLKHIISESKTCLEAKNK